MIRKLTEIRAPHEPVRELFLDIEAWPQWMPGIRRAKIQKRGEGFAEVELRTVFRGTEYEQVMEFRMYADRFQQRQISGRFKKWWAEWRFQRAANDSHTVLNMALDIDLGLVGMFIPSRMVDSALNDWFTQLVQQAEKRLLQQELRQQATAPKPLPPDSAPERIIGVFQTAKGLEVWVREQRYCIPFDTP
jgi:ribosome-associated toxin RatA of RatAB toxin-antitoxin module